MTNAGARLAHWWVDVVTRTAPESMAADRREEIRSDVFEQQAAGSSVGVRTRSIQRAIVGRVLRGVPADIVWRVSAEVAPERWRWHLRNTATVITAVMMVMLPINFVADSVPDVFPRLISIYSAVWGLTFLLGWIQIGIAAAAIAARLAPGFLAGVPDVSTLPRLVRARRAVLTVMGVSLAVSALGRAHEIDAISLLAGAGWVTFVLALGVLILLGTASLVTKGLHFRKISS